jgi:hypothetical protein
LEKLRTRQSLTRTGAGKMQLQQFGDKYMQTLDYKDKDLNKALDFLNDDLAKTGDAAWEASAGVKGLFKAFGGNTEMLSQLKIEEVVAMGMQFKERIIEMMAAKEYTKVSEQIIKNQKEHLAKLRNAHEEFGTALGQVAMQISAFVGRMTALSKGREEIKLAQGSQRRQRMETEMGLQIQLMKPFLGTEETQKYAHLQGITSMISQDTSQRAGIDANFRISMVKTLAGIFKQSAGNMQKAFGASLTGDESRRQELELRASKTKPQADAMAGLMDMINEKLATGGMSGADMKTFIEGQINTNLSLRAIRNDTVLTNSILDGLATNSQANNIAIIKQADSVANQAQLLQLNNTYQLQQIALMKDLNFLGGIEEYTRGTHSHLKKMDRLATENARMSISPGIQQGRAAMGVADFYKNSMGISDLPAGLVGTAIAGRAVQMSETAATAERITGIEVPAWMKDPADERLLGVAEAQVSGQLKDVLPEKMEAVRAQLITLSTDIARENSLSMSQQPQIMQTALENVLGTQSSAITGGLSLSGLNSSLSRLLDKQGLLTTAQQKQQAAFRFATKGQEAGARAENSRIEMISRFNKLFQMMPQTGDAQWQVLERRSLERKMGFNVGQQGLPFDQTTQMSDAIGQTEALGIALGKQIQRQFKARFDTWRAEQFDKKDFWGAEEDNANKRIFDEYKRVSSDTGMFKPNTDVLTMMKALKGVLVMERSKVGYAGTAYGGQAVTGKALDDFGDKYGGTSAQAQIAALDSLIGGMTELYSGGAFERLESEYDQQQTILAQANVDRAAAENGLVTTINTINQRYQTMLQHHLGPPVPPKTPIRPPSKKQLPHNRRGGMIHASQGQVMPSVGLGMRGKWVWAEPKGTDTIPAMLSPKEYVVNARAASKPGNRKILDTMNYMAAGGPPASSGPSKLAPMMPYSFLQGLESIVRQRSANTGGALGGLNYNKPIPMEMPADWLKELVKAQSPFKSASSPMHLNILQTFVQRNEDLFKRMQSETWRRGFPPQGLEARAAIPGPLGGGVGHSNVPNIIAQRMAGATFNPLDTWKQMETFKGTQDQSVFWQKDAFADQAQQYNLETAGFRKFAEGYQGYVQGEFPDKGTKATVNEAKKVALLQKMEVAFEGISDAAVMMQKSGSGGFNTWDQILKTFGAKSQAATGGPAGAKATLTKASLGRGGTAFSDADTKAFSEYIEKMAIFSKRAKVRPGGAGELMKESKGDLTLKKDVILELQKSYKLSAQAFNQNLTKAKPGAPGTPTGADFLTDHTLAVIKSKKSVEEATLLLHNWNEELAKLSQTIATLTREKQMATAATPFDPKKETELKQAMSDRYYLQSQIPAAMQHKGQLSLADRQKASRERMKVAMEKAIEIKKRKEGLRSLVGGAWKQAGGGNQGFQIFSDEFSAQRYDKDGPTDKGGVAGMPIEWGKMRDSYDNFMNSIDKSASGAENYATQEEYKTRVGKRLIGVFEMIEERGLSVAQATKIMKNEFMATALRMKAERGEISGRALRSGQSQYYQNKVNTSSYGFGDMKGTFLSQFARNQMDDWQDLKDMIESTAITMRTGFSSAFKEFAHGTKTAKEAFGDFAMSILDNILNRALDFGTENFMAYLFGQKMSAGGIVRPIERSRGGPIDFHGGGRVKGGSGPNTDDVAANLLPGEYVIRASSAKKIGYNTLEEINQFAGVKHGGPIRMARGGSIAAVLRNRVDYDDPKQPKTMVYNVDPMLSSIGQEDTINPQNQKKFQREEAFYQFKHSEAMRVKRNAERMRKFKQSQKQRMKAAYVNAAMTIVSGVAKGYANAPVGKFLNSVGGKMLVSTGFGAIMGGKEGAIMGAIGGLSAGVIGKMEQKAQLQQQMKADEMLKRKIFDIQADPKFNEKLNNWKRQKGMITNLDSVIGDQSDTRIPKSLYKDLVKMRDQYKSMPAGSNMDTYQFPKKKTAKEKWGGAWQGIKEFPGKLGKGAFDWTFGEKGPGTGGFWGNPGSDLFSNPFGNSRGGIIRRAMGGPIPVLGGSTNLMQMVPREDQMTQAGLPSTDIGLSAGPMSKLSAGGENAFSRGGSFGRKLIGGKDTVPGFLANGEYVLSPGTVAAIGGEKGADLLNNGDLAGFMQTMGWDKNQFAKNGGAIRGYAQGGLVGDVTMPVSTPGGIEGDGVQSINDNLVAVLRAIENVSGAIESSSGDREAPSGEGVRVTGGGRTVTNNIAISVTVQKGGRTTKGNQEESQEGEGGGAESKESDQKEKAQNRRLALMMESKVMEVILREQRPGGLLQD